MRRGMLAAAWLLAWLALPCGPVDAGRKDVCISISDMVSPSHPAPAPGMLGEVRFEVVRFRLPPMPVS